jgi:histidinol-phosphate phosphatase family protein
MLVHPSNHLHDSDLVEVDQNMKVKKIHTKLRSTPVLVRNLCNAGVYAINRKTLQGFGNNKLDLDRDIIPKLVDEDVSVYCERNKGFVRDIGTPERLSELLSKIEDTNFSDPRPALFIDRDGTINVQAEFITSWRQIRLHEDAVRLIKRCNQSRYWVFVITNQSVLARGLINIDQLKEIHSYIDLQLSENGAYVDDYFFCPHHPDSGYEGEVIDLKIKCDCRKPKSGLIEECIKQYSVDLKKSIVVGDSWRDKMLAENLELQFYIVNRNNLEQLPGTISTLDDIQIS